MFVRLSIFENRCWLVQVWLASLCRGTGVSRWTSAIRETLKHLRGMSNSPWAGSPPPSFMVTTLRWWKTLLVSEQQLLDPAVLCSVNQSGINLFGFFFAMQEERVLNRGWGHHDCPRFPPKRRATSRGLVISSASVISPLATSPTKTTHQAGAAAASSLTGTWLSWLTRAGPTPDQSGSILSPGVLDGCWILSRWTTTLEKLSAAHTQH